jgi:tRNA (adenine57-N1/adenine58-N1)-methyltransferase
MDEWVLLTSQKGKKWLVKIENGPYFSHLGGIEMSDVVGREEGEYIETNTGAKVFLFRPTLEDYIFQMKRPTQIIYPKDLGVMVFYGDVKSGDVVLESGIGSGALSMALLRAMGERGRLISVEKRPEFALQAMENISRFLGGRPGNHEVVVGDIQDTPLGNIQVDRIFLDLPEPWHAISSVFPLLRWGGLLVSLSPNVGQVQLMFRELKAQGFANIVNFELIKRDWMVDEVRARPVDRMISHTGFITVAKKIPPMCPNSSN